MQKGTLTLLLMLSLNLGFSQNTDNYIINYKLINLKENLSFFEKIIWEGGGIQYTFFLNKNVCFLIDFQVTAPANVNLKLNTTGSTKAYLNYKNDKFYYDLNGEMAYNLKKIKFKKIESGKAKFMGFDITKYKSVDGNIEVFTTKELPWYVQPCAFANNRFDGAILKLINHKTDHAVVMTDYKQITEVPGKYEDIIKKIKNHPATKVKKIVSPFLAAEEKKNKKVE